MDASKPLEDNRPLIEQVRARTATPYRWIDILVWEQNWLKLKGHSQEEIDEALAEARILNAADMVLQAKEYTESRKRIRAIQEAERLNPGVDQRAVFA